MPSFGSNVTQLNDFLLLLEKGLSQVLHGELQPHDKLYTDWLAERTAEEWIEDEVVVSAFGAMPEKEIGGAITVDQPRIGSEKEFTLKPYALAFVAEYELIRWEKYGVFTAMTKKMARSGIDRKNVLAYSILNNAFSTADAVYTTYAEDALCSNSHTMLRGEGTGKNAPSIDIDISYLGLQEAVTDFMDTINEDGLYIALNASKLIVSTTKKWVAETLVKSEYRPDNANMSYNSVKGEFSIHCAPYLTTANAWFLIADKKTMKPNMSFDIGDDLQFRRSYELASWNQVFTMYASMRVRVLTWYGIWGSQGT